MLISLSKKLLNSTWHGETFICMNWINFISPRLIVIFQHNFELALTKSFSQNVSNLMLKVLLSQVTEKTFMCLLRFEFFSCSRKTVILLFDGNKSVIKHSVHPALSAQCLCVCLCLCVCVCVWGGGLNLLPNFQKGGTWQDLNFYRGVAAKEGEWLFPGDGVAIFT